MVFTLICGHTYSGISTLFGLLGINTGSKTTYHDRVVPKAEEAVEAVLKFLVECRNKTPDKRDLHLVIDAGWSHPGWWARECTVIAIDGKTGLPIEIVHVLKGRGYTGSSRGTILPLV